MLKLKFIGYHSAKCTNKLVKKDGGERVVASRYTPRLTRRGARYLLEGLNAYPGSGANLTQHV